MRLIEPAGITIKNNCLPHIFNAVILSFSNVKSVVVVQVPLQESVRLHLGWLWGWKKGFFEEISTESHFHTLESNCCSFSLQSIGTAASWETRSTYQPSLVWENPSLCPQQTEILCGKAGLHFCHIVCPVWEGTRFQPINEPACGQAIHFGPPTCKLLKAWEVSWHLVTPGSRTAEVSWWGADPVKKEVVF